LDLFQWEELSQIQFNDVILRFILAAIGGRCIALIASMKSDSNTDKTISTTFVLMCVLIAMATQIIGSNVARAFSLVGALSIVRFRTAITSSQDVAFVLASVVVGMAVGAGQYVIALLGLITLACVMWYMRYDQPRLNVKPGTTWRIHIRSTLGGEVTCISILENLFGPIELMSAQTARKGSAVEYEYRVSPHQEKNAAEVLTLLGEIPQIESVSIKCDPQD
jgi:uncharacterized membrane protein YhiD involved in acid resistance